MADARVSFPNNGPKGDCAVLGKGRAATVCEGGATAVSIGSFAQPVVFSMCSKEPCSQRSLRWLVASPAHVGHHKGNVNNPRCSATTDETRSHSMYLMESSPLFHSQ